MSPARSVAARRRSRPSLLARMRIMWVVLLVGGVALGIAAYFVMLWPGFAPVIVSVSGSHHVTAREITGAAALDEHANLWLQSKRSAEARIEALPYIKKAAIHRSLPARVRISVTERLPAAAIELEDGSLALIDDMGRMLQRGMPRSSNYAVIEKVRAPVAPAGTFVAVPTIGRLMNDARMLSAAGVAVRSIGQDRFGQLAVTTRAGLRIQFGADSDLPAKVRLIDPILRTVGARLGSVAGLDLRSPKTPIVVYR